MIYKKVKMIQEEISAVTGILPMNRKQLTLFMQQLILASICLT